MGDEVARRKRIAIQVDATYRDLKRDIQNIEYIHYIGQKSPFPRRVQADASFKRAYGLFSQVIELVEEQP
jgi:hypothetical protein